ncbi:MAG TPA: hypothetical protein VGQ24_03360 [Gemmatimonadales bacterium]|nr:hypothetical protein [Gemmatimonadales bacterium]
MHRKHTVHVFRDLPDLIYRMLSQVSSMGERIDREIGTMKVRELPPHHIMVEAIKGNVVPASRLPKLIEPKYEEFTQRTAWSLSNASTEVQRDLGRERRWSEASGFRRCSGRKCI